MILCILSLYSCSTESVIRKSIETAYQAAVDERSISHIANDKKLEALIMKDILSDDVTKLLDISVKCYFGFPFVVGHCKTLDEAAKVVEIARMHSGKPVVPYIVKKGEKEEGCNMAVNLKITAELKARFVADKKIFESNFFVKTVNCTPVITGVAGSKDTIKSIIRHAKNTGGVKDIRSFVVETGSNRSWDTVFKSITEMAKNNSNDNKEPEKEITD